MAEKRSFTEAVTAAGDKISSNRYLQAVSQGVMSMLPVIIIGAFASLFSGLPVGFWQDFIAATGINSLLSMVVAATTNMLGLYFTYGIARALSEKLEVKSKLVGVLAMVVYLTLLPAAAMENGTAVLSYDYLGTKGMLVGILLAFLTVKVYKFIVDRNITIKMPAGTPDYVANTFVGLIPGFVIVILAMVIRAVLTLTPYGDMFNCLYSLLQIPLTALIGGSIVSNVVIGVISQFFWVLGIHPGFIQSMTAPILFSLDGMNQAAYAAGEAVPNIIGMAFSYSTTTAVFYPAIAVATLLFAKSGQLKTVGKIAVAPAFFGISEPMVFGLPVVLNPVIAIPWMLAPAVNLVIAYALNSIGLVAHYAGVTVFNFPMVATGLVNGSFSIVVMEIALFVIDILIFMPFIKMQDKKYLEEEKAAAEAEQN